MSKQGLISTYGYKAHINVDEEGLIKAITLYVIKVESFKKLKCNCGKGFLAVLSGITVPQYLLSYDLPVQISTTINSGAWIVKTI
jgi:hypothetical protein